MRSHEHINMRDRSCNQRRQHLETWYGGGISNKERKGSVLQGGQEGRPRKASVKVKCHSAASSEPKCEGGGCEKSRRKDRSRTRVKSFQRKRTCGKFVVLRGSQERHFSSTVRHVKMTGTL